MFLSHCQSVTTSSCSQQWVRKKYKKAGLKSCTHYFPLLIMRSRRFWQVDIVASCPKTSMVAKTVGVPVVFVIAACNRSIWRRFRKIQTKITKSNKLLTWNLIVQWTLFINKLLSQQKVPLLLETDEFWSQGSGRQCWEKCCFLPTFSRMTEFRTCIAAKTTF